VALMVTKTNPTYANQIQEAVAKTGGGINIGGGSAEPKIGNAVTIKNQVEGVTEKGPQPILAGTDVYRNELVRTGLSGMAQLLFADRTNLSVAPVTEIRLDSFVYDPNAKSGNVVINAAEGAFRFIPPAAADDAPLSNDSQDEASGPDLALDLAKVFFEVDTERAVAVARSELGSRNTGRAGANRDPTEDFFSVDIERAVRLVRDELGEAVYTTDHPGAVGETDTTDPTREIFSTDMDRVLRAVLRKLEEKPH
jgi:hypothetical protein